MSNSVEELKEELEQRIRSHRPSDPFDPSVTFRQRDDGEEIIVQYYLDLPDGQRSIYNRNFYDGDRSWVEQRGNDYDLTAMLFCEWQT